MSFKNYISKADRVTLQEANDCSVVAVHKTTRVSYKVVHKVFSKMGRVNQTGSTGFMITQVIQALGYRSKPIYHECFMNRDRRQYTAKTVAEAFTGGVYMVYFKGHVVAMVDGVIHDWIAESNHKVVQIREVIPKSKVDEVEDKIDHSTMRSVM